MFTTTPIDISNQAYELHSNAVNLRNEGKYDEAAAKWAECTQLVPDEPRYLIEYADCLGRMRRWADQRRTALYAAALEPTNAEGWALAGCAAGNLGQQDDARRFYDRALAIAPHSPAIAWNRSLHCLLHGEYKEGWRDYEYRFVQHQRNRTYKPQWNGSPIPGKTLFVWAEQGLGDTIQFIRFLDRARRISQCSRLVLECQREIVPLVLDNGYADEVVCQTVGWSILENDFEHVALMSLPYVLGINDDSEFWYQPYMGATPIDVVTPLEHGKRIGVCWRGYAGHSDDAIRSISNDDFFNAIIRGRDNANWYSINPSVRLPEDVPNCVNTPLPTFVETASLIASLDIVITVDTSVAHLAGALGVPVWILLRFATDWRWCLKYPASSPWYESARLFRQPSYSAGWNGVLTDVAAALDTEVLHG